MLIFLVDFCVAVGYIITTQCHTGPRAMNDKAKTTAPPYATFSAFINFLNKLRETTVPSRIDPSVFGNASGSLSYSIISTLKFLKLIDESGVPSQQFIELANATDDARGPLLKVIIQKGYPSLFQSPINLTTMTAGQFDEHIRQEFGAAGSTIDKIALFFIAACRMAEIPVSAHLLNRKPIATSSTAKKSAKQRRRDVDDDVVDEDDPFILPNPAGATKALEYQLIDLMSEPDIDADVKASIWSIVQYLMARKAKKETAAK
jgi:hypothetical protein